MIWLSTLPTPFCIILDESTSCFTLRNDFGIRTVIHVHVVVPHYVLCITWQEFLINKRSAVGVFYAVLAKSFDKTI